MLSIQGHIAYCLYINIPVAGGTGDTGGDHFQMTLGDRLGRRGVFLFFLCSMAACVIIPAFICLSIPNIGTGGTRSSSLVDEKYAKSVTTLNLYDVKNDKIIKIGLEDYIVGVVAGEMPVTFEPEALKAQAVAARTYTLEKMQNGGSVVKVGADMSTDSSKDQAYSDRAGRQARWGSSFEANEKKVEDAVQATKGQIMVYDGEPIKALFHSTSGGMTEDVENVYSAFLPYLRSVESKGEEDAPHFTGTKTVTADEYISTITKQGGKISGKSPVGSVGDIKRTASGRVDTIVIGGKSFSGRDIRSFFDLDSTNFTIDLTDSSVTFHTKGYGHGVGMSQTGANAMAKSGSNYVQILKHYYTGVKIAQMTQ